MSKQTISVFGLGSMGFGVACSALAAGHNVFGFDVNIASQDRFLAKGGDRAEIVDAVGDQIDVICDGGIQRGTHVLKALSVGAKACSGGRWYLYALAGAGQAGVERALTNMQSELVRDMKLMGAKTISDLSRANLRFR